MDNGTVASYQDNSSHGDDALLSLQTGPKSALDAVFDGVSTGGLGRHASSLVAGRLRDASIRGAEDVCKVLRLANASLREEGRDAATTATVALKTDDWLTLIMAGDSPAYLVRDGKLTELFKPDRAEYNLSMITNAVGIGDRMVCHTKRLRLREGDRLVLLTDGISDNIAPEELAKILTAAKTPQDAITRLKLLLQEKKRRRVGREDMFRFFKDDDRTAIIRFIGPER